MNFGADLSELAGLARDLGGAAAQSDRNIVHAQDKVAEKMVEEIRAQVPVSDIEHEHLVDAVGFERVGPSEMRIGYIKGEAARRGHLLEDGTVNQAPRPIVKPAGDRFHDEYARELARQPVFKP